MKILAKLLLDFELEMEKYDNEATAEIGERTTIMRWVNGCGGESMWHGRV